MGNLNETISGAAAGAARSGYAEAYAKYNAAVRQAVKFQHSNWTNSAITRERHKLLQAARAELAQTLGVDGVKPAADPEVLQRDAFQLIAATDANSVAVAANEWMKVRTLLDAGRNLSQIIDNADQRRLSAILDHLDSDLAIQTDDPAGVAAEVSQAVLVRLAGLGDGKAQEAITAQESSGYDTAWRNVIEQATGGPVTLDARTALYQANVDEYRVAFDDDDMEATEIEQAVANLDRLAPTLNGEGE